MAPILPPVIISDAITSVYKVIAVWMPVTVVPTSAATCRIETFITELSSVIKNWPEASTDKTKPLPASTRPAFAVIATHHSNHPQPTLTRSHRGQPPILAATRSGHPAGGVICLPAECASRPKVSWNAVAGPAQLPGRQHAGDASHQLPGA